MKTKSDIVYEEASKTGVILNDADMKVILRSMDTHASQVAIGFAEWACKNYYFDTGAERWRGAGFATTSELYEKFLTLPDKTENNEPL